MRAALDQKGVRVLGYGPDNALMVSSDRPPGVGRLGATWAGSLLANEILSPDLDAGPRNAFLVMMQPDVAPDDTRKLLRLRGFVILDQPGLLPGDFVVIGPYRGIYSLAASDEVAYIMPPSNDLLSGQPVMACTGAVIRELQNEMAACDRADALAAQTKGIFLYPKIFFGAAENFLNLWLRSL